MIVVSVSSPATKQTLQSTSLGLQMIEKSKKMCNKRQQQITNNSICEATWLRTRARSPPKIGVAPTRFPARLASATQRHTEEQRRRPAPSPPGERGVEHSRTQAQLLRVQCEASVLEICSKCSERGSDRPKKNGMNLSGSHKGYI